MNKIIKKYIQFAIDNGYEFFAASSVRKIESKHKVFRWREFPQYWTIKIHCLDDCDVPKEITITNENYCNTITSKSFIEAVANGLMKEEWIKENYDKILKNTIDDIILNQAFAITYSTLDDFIKGILWIKEDILQF